MQMQLIIEKFLRSEKSKEYKLNSFDLIILVILASYMGEKDHCWPSKNTLARECGMSIDTVKRSLSKLKKLNIIYVECINNNQNTYWFNLEIVYIKINEGGLIAPPGGLIDPPGGLIALPGGANSTPNNIINNIKNNIRNNKGRLLFGQKEDIREGGAITPTPQQNELEKKISDASEKAWIEIRKIIKPKIIN